MALLFVAAVVYKALFVRVHGFPLYVALTLAFGGYFLAAVVCSLRDLRNWRSVAYVQIIISIIAGVVALLGSDISPTGVIAFAMAVFSASTGFARLAEIDAAELQSSAMNQLVVIKANPSLAGEGGALSCGIML